MNFLPARCCRTAQNVRQQRPIIDWIPARKELSMKQAGRKLIVFCAFVIGAWAVAGSAWGKIAVFVSIAPQKYFVQQIGKNFVDVQVMVPPGADPHTYEPKPRQMVALAKAQLYFAIGVEFEKARLKKISSTNPQMEVIDTDQGIQKIPMSAHQHHDEEINHEEEKNYEKDSHAKEPEYGSGHEHHEHGGLDPHIWLSPPLVMKQAKTILAALQEVDPAHHSIYQANYEAFSSEIADLDTELRNIFAGKQGLQFIVFHPAWGYFAQAYGLEQVPVEIEGKNPKPARLKKLIEIAKEKNIKVIFVQPQFSAKSAELIAREIDGQVVSADPLAQDWANNLRAVANKFKAALR
jgi:zinc transport system substrate-binding protein